MDWIDGYHMTEEGLYSPSGAKIATISHTSVGAFVLPVSPELREEFGGAVEGRSAEAQCQKLVMAHAKHLRVVPADDVRDGVAATVNKLVEIHGDGAQVHIGDVNVNKAVREASPPALTKVLKEGIPNALAGSGIASIFKMLAGS